MKLVSFTGQTCITDISNIEDSVTSFRLILQISGEHYNGIAPIAPEPLGIPGHAHIDNKHILKMSISMILKIKNVLWWVVVLIKSPRSGVCFQSVSAASAAAKTFPSHVKTISAKPSIFGTKNIWVWGNILDDLSMTLTKGHGCGIH